MRETEIPPAPWTAYEPLKRVIDLVGAVLLGIAASPVLFASAVAILVDSGGPVLHRQTRVGRQGRSFVCLKLRTMHAGADDGAHRRFMVDHIAGRTRPIRDADSGRAVYRLVDDPRITRVGAVLRRWSTDELPQLWNVIRGEMSLVGPRPPLPFEVALYRPDHLVRLSVRPGMTGLWQCTSWDAATFQEMADLDSRYVRERSLRLDGWILARTLRAVTSR